MIGGWLLKVVLGLVVLGIIVVDGGSPWIVKAQADDIAHEAADDAALLLGRRADFTDADIDDVRERIEAWVENKDAALTEFLVDSNDLVHVTVAKQATSLVVKRVTKAADDYYEVEASASSKVK